MLVKKLIRRFTQITQMMIKKSGLAVASPLETINENEIS